MKQNSLQNYPQDHVSIENIFKITVTTKLAMTDTYNANKVKPSYALYEHVARNFL